MNYDLEQLARLNQGEKELFAQCLNALFTTTFIQRAIEKERKLYQFVIANYSLFETYLSYADWSLRKDENSGIITWYGPASARFSLNLEETLALLVLRLFYEEKRMDISVQQEKTIQQLDFQEKYRVLTNRTLNKTRLVALMRRFQSLRLIRVLGAEADPESLVILYPSIAFALDGETLDDIQERISSLAGQSESREQGQEERGRATASQDTLEGEA